MKFLIEARPYSTRLLAQSEPDDGTDGVYRRTLVHEWELVAPSMRDVMEEVNAFWENVEMAAELQSKVGSRSLK
jgi:hypothetical protein